MALEQDDTLIFMADILRMMRWSRGKFRKFKPELQAANILLEYRTKGNPGFRYAMFPSDLKQWARLKALKGEKI